MITRMAKVRIVGSRSLLEPLTKALQESGVVHIESSPAQGKRIPLDRLSLDPDHQKKKIEWETLLRILKNLLLILPEAGSAGKRQEPAPGEQDLSGEIRHAVGEIQPQLDAVLNQLKESEEEQSLLMKYERVLEALSPLLQRIQDSYELDFLGLVLETEKKSALSDLRTALSDFTQNRYELFLSRMDRKTLAGLLVIPRELAARVRSALWQENISELRLPASLSDKPVGQALKILLKRRVELPRRIQELRESLRRLSLLWRNRLQEYERFVENSLARLESTHYFFQTRSTFLVYGWIPEKDLTLLRKRINELFAGKVILENIGFSREELKDIPVALHNPRWVRPFEMFIRRVALPRYGSIDPTPFLAIFFPLFFGLIFGDIGYGVILLGGSLYGLKRWKDLPLVRGFSRVFILASLSTIIFGVLYGEFFGELGEPFGIRPLLLNRMEGFIPFIKITLAIGIFHVFLGIFLGLVTLIRYREGREFAVKACGLAFLSGFLMALGGVAGLLSRSAGFTGGSLAAGSLTLIFILGGARSAMELHSIVNVLSYLRLMGIGVASASLAFAANTLGKMPKNILAGIVIGFVLHVINFLFGIFSPTIQSLRLHYVEFFENFFQPGGREYRPFKKQL